MFNNSTRRTLLQSFPAIGVAAFLGLPNAWAADSHREEKIDSGFPRQDLSAVESVVTFSHFDLSKVKELVDARPALAKACWDWGFGDWESAIGAASHKGEREIAEYLIEKGASPTLFTFAMLGHVDAVRAMVKTQAGIQSTRGPHGLTLMHHAREGGEQAKIVVEFLQEIGGADVGEIAEDIPSHDQEQILGTYAFGESEDERLHILTVRGELRIKRSGRVSRRLSQVEKFTYHPAGAPSVRIRFDGTGPVDRLTIEDSKIRVDASRHSR